MQERSRVRMEYAGIVWFNPPRRRLVPGAHVHAGDILGRWSQEFPEGMEEEPGKERSR